MKFCTLLLGAVLTLGCVAHPRLTGPGQVISTAPVSLTTNEPRPHLRLEDDVKPTAYSVDLTVSPNSTAFSGTVRIDLQLSQPRRTLWLNATGLKISHARVQSSSGAQEAQVVFQDRDFLALELATRVPAGLLKLVLTFTGRVTESDSTGIFREKENGDFYLFTQFESQFARAAFPCLDQPNFKTPWRLTLHVPEAFVAVSNTPVQETHREALGMKSVTFRPTLPLPSYLVAFGVGPFDHVQFRPAGRNHVPVGLYMPRGHKGEERLAADVTPKGLELLEDYFDMPYPYEKLDLLAMPVAVTFGAMENAGLITATQRSLLATPEERSISSDRATIDNVLHELSHQWFGDLVTTAWWDDLWLNESFATWLTSKMEARYRPDWPTQVMRVRAQSDAFDVDRLASARAVRQPILVATDMGNIFDSITYQKGAAVIEMFENWVTPELFQRGVQSYMRKYAFGTATAPQFLAEISAAAGRDVAIPFATFLDQAGVPLVTSTVQCSPKNEATLSLTQSRYLPLGAPRQEERLWQIPVCASYPSAGSTRMACTLMTSREGVLPLPGTHGCPAWVWPDSNSSGYYLSNPTGNGLAQVWDRAGVALSPATRIGLIGAARAGVDSGDRSPAELLTLVARAVQDPDPSVQEAAVEAAWIPSNLLTKTLEAPYSRFLQKTFGPLAQKVGFAAKPGEDAEIKILRPALMELLGLRGQATSVIQDARKLARAYLEDPASVDANIAPTALLLAAHSGDAKLQDAFIDRAAHARNRKQMQLLLAGLGEFDAPELVQRSLNLVLDPRFDPRESLAVLEGDASSLSRGQRDGSLHSREQVYEFVKKNYDALARVLPPESVRSLGFPAALFCEAGLRKDAGAFFTERMKTVVGGPRALSHVLEAIDICIAQKAALTPKLSVFLSRY